MASWAMERARAATPDPRSPKRHKARQDEWSDIHRAFEFQCCVNCGLRYESLHHILPRSQGGSDVVENLVALCGDGTRGCHGLLESHGPGWERVAAAIRQYVITNNARRNYQEEHAGESFLRRYPPLANTDPQFVDDLRTLRPPLEAKDVP